MSDEQLSKCQGGPLAFLWFCLLHVEVLFCCMRRSAVSLACSEPGWERWREGTTQSLRLWPSVRFSPYFFSLIQSVVCTLDFLSPLFLFLFVTLPIVSFSWIDICFSQQPRSLHQPPILKPAAWKTNKAGWVQLMCSCILKS